MAVLPIVIWPDPRLSVQTVAVNFGGTSPDRDLAGLIADMFDTMYAAQGRGLAAPQVGVLKRLFVMDCGWKDRPQDRAARDQSERPMVFLNPEILWTSEHTAPYEEGCLSIPGVLTQVQRPEQIRLRWQDQTGSLHEDEFSGFEARCIQHEIDHLFGRITFDHLPAEARKAAETQFRAAQEDTRQ